MGLVLPQEVEMKWNNGNKDIYTSKGYIFTNIGDTFNINVLDLSKHSSSKVRVECDICKTIREVSNAYLQLNYSNEYYICPDTKLHKTITLEQEYQYMVNSLKNFIEKYNRLPKYNEYLPNDGLPSYNECNRISKRKGLTLNEVLTSIDFTKLNTPNPLFFNEYVNKLKDFAKIYGRCLSHSALYNNEYGIPNALWFVKHCPDKSIKSFPEFLNWCGLSSYSFNSKEHAIKTIYDMQNNLDRPLMYDDFRENGYNKITISTIKKYWGTMNKMKEELGLEIIQESMIDKHCSISEVKDMVVKVCNEVYNNDGRTLITESDFDSRPYSLNATSLRNRLRQECGIDLRNYIETIGFEMVNAGNGLNFEYFDGEKTVSQFEYLFSNYLRDSDLTYNVDYFRNIPYKTFIANYVGNMNCDYVINYNNKSIYIEIAGVLREYKEWYYQNKNIFQSKSKEKYRVKLSKKEYMLSSNNIEYYILFPCDITKENLLSILSDDYVSTFNRIKSFNFQNIKFQDVLKIGELKYTQVVDNRTKDKTKILGINYLNNNKEGEKLA